MCDLQKKLNEIINYVENEKCDDEMIDEQSVLEAFEIIEQQKLATDYDCFKYFASLNLLNAYVKKDYATNKIKNNYSFKKYVLSALQVLTQVCPQGVQFGFGSGNVIYLQVYSLQFSFHSAISKKINLNLQPMEWQGVRLQPFALYIFKQAVNAVV